jgi:RNA polymerase sigma factor (sigma-70 family)
VGPDGDYSAAARRLVEALRSSEEIDGEDLGFVEVTLNQMLATRYPALGAADRSDVVAEVILRLISLAREGRIDPDREPGAYLSRMAANRSVDLLRRPQSLSLEETVATSSQADDEIAALLDSDATKSAIVATIRSLRDDGEHEVARVAARYFVEAQRIGKAPTTREAGAALGISHDKVARALRTFRERLRRILDES